MVWEDYNLIISKYNKQNTKNYFNIYVQSIKYNKKTMLKISQILYNFSDHMNVVIRPFKKLHV